MSTEQRPTSPLRRNSDPALDPAHQHTHEHLHHDPGVSPRASQTYTRGTTDASAHVVPPQSSLHAHDDHTEPALKTAGSRSNSDIESKKVAPAYEDPEKVGGITHAHHGGDGDGDGDETGPHHRAPSRPRLFYKKYRIVFHLVIFAFFTGWWIASLVLHRHDKNWIIPFLLWLFISLRLLTFHVPARYAATAIKFVWKSTAVRVYDVIPSRFRVPAGAALTIAVMLAGSFGSPPSEDNSYENRAVSLFGLLVFIAVLWTTSRSRKDINWRTVIGGMLSQYIIALFVLRTEAGYDIFRFIADLAAALLGFAKEGVEFLTDDVVAFQTFYFIILVIPAIIFFVSLVQVLYYIGFIQWFIGKFAVFVFWALNVSGAEAVVAAATPFIGQGESAMLVRPFVPHMTKAELHQIMTCGFATISGSVLVGYIGLGLNAQVLVSSCIMSIPAALAISKLRYPETEETLTAGKVVIPDDDEHEAQNALHAFANGSWLGIKIAGTIIGALLCIIAAVGLVNGLLGWWGYYININVEGGLSLQLILGYMLYPVAFLLGIPRNADLLKVAELIAEKVITNEYVAFTNLTGMDRYTVMSPRSRLIATYALCGFGNIGSLGIQIGILSQLAPSRGGDVAKLALSALASGVLATLTSATVAGLVITDQSDLIA